LRAIHENTPRTVAHPLTLHLTMFRISATLVASIACGHEGVAFDSDEALQLLQVGTRSHAKKPVNDEKVFDQCASFGNAADIVGSGEFNPRRDDLQFCRCWGDTHCDFVPFDKESGSADGRLADNHYQYDGYGVSRFAKAADGSWEMQIHQCGVGRVMAPGGQNGIAIKVQGTVVEAILSDKGGKTKCYVNGEEKPPNFEMHLPTGFHFKCPNGPNEAFCATKDGQFVASTNLWWLGWYVNQVLAIPTGVAVQESGTVCFDSATDGFAMPTAAIVPEEEIIFSAAAMQLLQNPGRKCNIPKPLQSVPPPEDVPEPQVICDEKGPGVWAKVEAECHPLKDAHPGFYLDCLIDECVRASEDDEIHEEAVIEQIAEVDEPVDADEAAAVADPHMSTSAGNSADMCCDGHGVHRQCKPC